MIRMLPGLTRVSLSVEAEVMLKTTVVKVERGVFLHLSKEST
jgi:hypothetical protein